MGNRGLWNLRIDGLSCLLQDAGYDLKLIGVQGNGTDTAIVLSE